MGVAGSRKNENIKYVQYILKYIYLIKLRFQFISEFIYFYLISTILLFLFSLTVIYFYKYRWPNLASSITMSVTNKKIKLEDNSPQGKFILLLQLFALLT